MRRKLLAMGIIVTVIGCGCSQEEQSTNYVRKTDSAAENTEQWTEEVTAADVKAGVETQQIEIIKMPVKFVNENDEAVFQLFADNYQDGEWGSNLLPDDVVIQPGDSFDGYVYIETGYTAVDFMIKTNSGTKVYENVELGQFDVQQGATVTLARNGVSD